MTADPRWEKIKSLFDEALRRPQDERRTWLAEACADDDLRREVEGMLAAHDRTRGVLETPIDLPASGIGADEQPTAVRPGATLHPTWVGPYRLIRRIGEGGMGIVYQAHDPRLDRHVALKFLPQRLADPATVVRFRTEAKAASALDHPNICTVYDIGKTEDGRLYIAMAYYAGETLAERIARGPLAIDEAVDLALQAACGLARAHEAGIVHRDVKPANLAVTDRPGPDRLKILDFGIAKLDSSELTDTGTTPGTLAYMPPEQLEGHAADPRGDVWSLGVVLYEMLTGEAPFRGARPAALIRSILEDEPRPLRSLRPEIPRSLEGVVGKALAKDPENRHISADELIEELEDLRAGTAPESIASRSPLASRAGTSPRWLLFHALSVAALLMVVALWRMEPSPESPAAPTIPRPTLTQLTFGAGMETQPSLSPDGELVVYSQTPTAGGYYLFLQRVGGQHGIQLASDAGYDAEPAFSPDGQRIAFRSERDGGGLFVMGATGESVRRLTDFGFSPSWSPDGQRIAFSTEGVFLAPGQPVNTAPELWEIELATGEIRRLAAEGGQQPSWSPDGRWIAYWVYGVPEANTEIRSLDLETGTSVAVTDHPATDWSPVWSPDGEWLYFVSDRGGGNRNLWRVEVETATGRALAPAQPATAPARSVGQFSIARERGRIAFTSQDWQKSIVSLPFDPERRAVTGPLRQVTTGTRDDDDAEPSPDGEWLVFTSWSSQTHADLYLCRFDGSELHQLTDHPAMDSTGVWSPDGSRIVFSSARSGRWEIWSIRPDGSELRQLTETSGTGVDWPVLSPDGLRLLAGAPGTRSCLFELRVPGPATLADAEALPQPDDDLEFQGVAWSPDGRYIAGDLRARSHRTRSPTAPPSRRRIAVYNVTEKHYELFLVGKESGRVNTGSWLEDSRTLLLADGDELLLFDFESGERVPFFKGSRQLRRPTLTRDQRTIFLSELTAEADLWLLSFD